MAFLETRLTFCYALSLVRKLRSGFKTSDQVQGQGVPQIEKGAYTLVREYFHPRDNTAIEPQMGF